MGGLTKLDPGAPPAPFISVSVQRETDVGAAMVVKNSCFNKEAANLEAESERDGEIGGKVTEEEREARLRGVGQRRSARRRELETIAAEREKAA